jgi:hypothetical protein
MNPEIFEIIMLICFGAAWPLSIYKLLKTKNSGGKSLGFTGVLLMGYLAGIMFEYLGTRDYVIYLYVFNTCLVCTDLMLTIKYRRKSI